MTNAIDRHHFLAGGLSLTGLALSSTSALAQMRPEDKFDLVVMGGDVLDPGAGLRGKRDVGVYRGSSRPSKATFRPPAPTARSMHRASS